MNSNLLFKVISLSILILTMISCAKEIDEQNPQDDEDRMIAAQNAITSQSIFGGINNQVENSIKDENENNTKTYPQITIEPADGTFPRTYTFNYGELGVYCSDGKVRKGKIIAIQTDEYINEGMTITTNLVDYSEIVNNIEYDVEGTQITENLGRNPGNNLIFSVKDENCTWSTDSGLVTWEQERINEWTAGENTLYYPFDDIYKLTGNAQGIDIAGNPYTITILSPVTVQIGCRWLTTGVIECNFNDFIMTIDYGTGNCDNYATGSAYGYEWPIVMQ